MLRLLALPGTQISPEINEITATSVDPGTSEDSEEECGTTTIDTTGTPALEMASTMEAMETAVNLKS